MWDVTFESRPQGTESPTTLNVYLRNLRSAIHERMSVQHEFDVDGTQTDHGKHSSGSARVYRQAAAPTNRPDGSTALANNDYDKGRLWFDSDDNYTPYVWQGTAFSNILQDGSSLFFGDSVLQADGKVTIGDDIVASTLRTGEYGSDYGIRGGSIIAPVAPRINRVEPYRYFHVKVVEFSGWNLYGGGDPAISDYASAFHLEVSPNDPQPLGLNVLIESNSGDWYPTVGWGYNLQVMGDTDAGHFIFSPYEDGFFDDADFTNANGKLVLVYTSTSKDG